MVRYLIHLCYTYSVRRSHGSDNANEHTPSTLDKVGGDAVLSQCGYSPSQAVRALWTYLCDHQDVPPFMKEAEACDIDADRQRKLSLIHDGAGLAIRAARQHGYTGPTGDLLGEKTWHQLRDEMYDDMIGEMEARCVYPAKTSA